MLLRQHTFSSQERKKIKWNVLIKSYQFSSRESCLKLHTSVHTTSTWCLSSLEDQFACTVVSLYFNYSNKEKDLFFVDADRCRRWNSNVVKMNLFSSLLCSTLYISSLTQWCVWRRKKKRWDEETWARHGNIVEIYAAMIDPTWPCRQLVKRGFKHTETEQITQFSQSMYSHFNFIIFGIRTKIVW